jgi:hypothetical protein
MGSLASWSVRHFSQNVWPRERSIWHQLGYTGCLIKRNLCAMTHHRLVIIVALYPPYRKRSNKSDSTDTETARPRPVQRPRLITHDSTPSNPEGSACPWTHQD